MTLSPQEVSNILNISVRTLHHYDEIGLVQPARDDNGYRTYSQQDMATLSAIVLLKELDMPLEEIKQRVQSPYFDLQATLEDSSDLLERKKKHIDELVERIQSYADQTSSGKNSSKTDVNGQHEYAAEAFARWGGTDAYKQSQQRTKHFTQDDWNRVKGEMDDITRSIAKLIGRSPHDTTVQAQMQRYYDFLRTFYELSPEFFAQLGDMYVTDPRFAKTYNDVAPGLAEFMRDAMEAFRDAQR